MGTRLALVLALALCLLTISCLPMAKPKTPECGMDHPEWWSNKCTKRAQAK